MAEKRMIEALINLPLRGLARVMRGWLFPAGRTYFPPDDRLERQAADLLLQDSEARDRLTHGLHLPSDPSQPLAQLDRALMLAEGAEASEKQLRKAQREGRIDSDHTDDLLAQALTKSVVTQAQAEELREYRALVWEIIQVDDFPADFGAETGGGKWPQQVQV